MIYIYFFFFKQKTEYELRISDWSSDVCSSDLAAQFGGLAKQLRALQVHQIAFGGGVIANPVPGIGEGVANVFVTEQSGATECAFTGRHFVVAALLNEDDRKRVV